MDTLKRAAVVTAFPFAAIWYLATFGVMSVTSVIGLVPVSLYSAGKYIATGDGGIAIPKYIDTGLAVMDNIGSRPLNILMNNHQPSITNVIKESYVTPTTLEEMKEIREKMDQEIARDQKPEKYTSIVKESELFKVE